MLIDDINFDQTNLQIPSMDLIFWEAKLKNYCLVIPVINEGERILNLLKKIKEHNLSDLIDIIIVDGGSIDGSLNVNTLKQLDVRGLIIKRGEGKLSSQLRCAYSFAIEKGYIGILTIDGNDKDDPSAIPNFVDALNEGYDFIQASRFIEGGEASNTPFSRYFAIRFIHAPMLSLASGFKWTDTTQGFRGYSRRVLIDPNVAPFRKIFCSYELLAYLSYRIPKLGYKCKELPTKRKYPTGEIPTKISLFKGNILVLAILVKACLGFYNPRVK